MNLVDLKERIALAETFTPDERDFLLNLVNGFPAEWSCGHVAGAMCQECYRELAAKAHELRGRLDTIADIAEGSTTANSLPHIAKIARK